MNVPRLTAAGWAAFAAAPAAALALAGCSLAPPYERPNFATPTTYKEAGPWTPASPADAAPRGDWWTVYGDQTLNDLEKRIETGNPDLAMSLARYDEARAIVTQVRAAELPEVDLGGFATNNGQSQFFKRHIASNATTTTAGSFDDNEVAATASYEFDVWGRVRNMVASGKAEAQASAADVATVRLSLQAQLADAYLNLRGLDAQSKLLADTTQAYSRALKLTLDLHDGGAVAGLDVGRAETQLQTAEAQETDVAAQRALFEHEIATLVGQPASTFSLAPVTTLPEPPHIPVAAPSVLLERRPDVAAAERRAAAANASIGVARAALYPDITLNAMSGFESAGGVNLLQASTAMWTLGPSVSLPLFDYGKRKAVVRQARDQFNEAGDTYRSTVLQAFQQVEDNLALCNKLAVEASQEALAVSAAQRTEGLALTQYQLGAVTYLDVVTAQTADLEAERTALMIATRRLQASVDLIRALGGGWSPAAPTKA